MARATVEITGPGYRLSLPEGFDEEDPMEGSRSFVESVPRPLRVNVTALPFDGIFADFLREAALAQAREGMRASSARRLRVGETEVAEVEVTPLERTLSLRVFVRAEARGGLGAVLTCTGTTHNLELTTALCEGLRGSLHLGPEALAAVPATVIGRRWVGAPGRWVSVPLEWIDQGTTAPQVAVARSPYADGEAVSAVLISPETVGDPRGFVSEVERSMAQGRPVDNRRESPGAGYTRVDFELTRERALSPVIYRQRYASQHGRMVMVTCGAPETVFIERSAVCDTILRSLRLGP